MVNIGIVGCGYWGPNLIRNFRSLTDCRVIKVCDKDDKRLNHMKEIYPEVDTTTDYSSLVDDDRIDAIVVATPVSTHFKLARMALQAGKHTFIEKPMAGSTEECQALNDIAHEKSLVLMVGHTFIYTATVRKIKEIIDSGDIGEVLYIKSQRLNLGLFQNDINVTWDLAPHDISIILYLINERPVSVNCVGKAHIHPKIEDVTTLTMDFSNNFFAIIQSSWLDPRKIREFTIIGSKKMIVYDDTEPLYKIKIYDQHVKIPHHYDTFGEFQFAYHYGDVYIPHIKQTEPLRIECQQFIDSIEKGEPSPSDGEAGMQIVRILEASTASLKAEGKKINL
ncbi:MAG: Gfo/Idh/MocA family oxidoreductase [Spirochaetales bacterium]|nr:Gfo/Idh/MocA family oxidoreductase [Spirochaetales bacterium]